jgi:hypothetical protein
MKPFGCCLSVPIALFPVIVMQSGKGLKRPIKSILSYIGRRFAFIALA